MLGDLSSRRLFFYNEPTDMRKGSNGLSGLVNEFFSTPLLGGDIFVFVNRSRNTIKLLSWDRTGFVIYHKKLEKGTFELPKGNISALEINYEMLFCMLEGIELTSIKKRKRQVIKA